MRFVFHTPAGMGYQIHARTATLALRKLREWSLAPTMPPFDMKDLIMCSISQDDYEYSHGNDEMMRAGHTVVNYFWSKLGMGVDAEVHVLPNN